MKDPELAPKVRAMAQTQQWAKKLCTTGWASLSKAQKKSARGALGLTVPTAVVVKTPRLVAGNPTNRRRARTEPGNLNRRTTVSQPEFISNVFPSESLTGAITTWTINPSIPETFPKLMSRAAEYENYMFTKLVVRFSSKCNQFTNGGLVISYCSDSTDPVPATKYDLLNTKINSTNSICTNVILNIPCDGKMRKVRDRKDDDGKVVDFGRLSICVYGQDAGAPTILGELSWDYTVVFSEQRFSRGVTQYCPTLTADSTGPQFVDCVVSDTALTFTFFVPGKYIFIVGFRATAGQVAAHNVEYKWDVTGTNSYAGVVTVLNNKGTLQWPTTAVTELLYYCARF